jgi:1,4-alpha-glucan branching enzyme
VQTLVRDLNALYGSVAGLYERDCEQEGFAWVDCTDADQSMLSYLRYGADRDTPIMVVCNFTPVPRHGYIAGVPHAGWYEEIMNSDAAIYGGTNVGNQGGVPAQARTWNGYPYSIRLHVPPLGAVVLRRKP